MGGECVELLAYGHCSPPLPLMTPYPAQGMVLVLNTECVYMPFDLCYITALPSRMRVIPCYNCSESLFRAVYSYIISQRPRRL